VENVSELDWLTGVRVGEAYGHSTTVARDSGAINQPQRPIYVGRHGPAINTAVPRVTHFHDGLHDHVACAENAKWLSGDPLLRGKRGRRENAGGKQRGDDNGWFHGLTPIAAMLGEDGSLLLLPWPLTHHSTILVPVNSRAVGIGRNIQAFAGNSSALRVKGDGLAVLVLMHARPKDVGYKTIAAGASGIAGIERRNGALTLSHDDWPYAAGECQL
jgi:hypothetical protein